MKKSDIMPEPLYRLKKKTPEKCQDCECLETNFKNDNWFWECSTKPHCYKEPEKCKCGAILVNGECPNNGENV